MSNYEQLDLFMNEHMENKQGWWGLKSKSHLKPSSPSETKQLIELISDLKRSNDDLAAEVWTLKTNIDFLLKSLNSK